MTTISEWLTDSVRKMTQSEEKKQLARLKLAVEILVDLTAVGVGHIHLDIDNRKWCKLCAARERVIVIVRELE